MVSSMRMRTKMKMKGNLRVVNADSEGIGRMTRRAPLSKDIRSTAHAVIFGDLFYPILILVQT